ncbi:MAG: acyltransferase family protein, partial [Gemmatimonas sp.]
MTTATTTSRPAPSHLLELDGFRALAVWMVMLDHMVDGWKLPHEAVEWMPSLLWQFVSHGWLGVDLFFILSGFLITGILIDSRGEQNYFRNFYMRRVLRILPLFYACCIIMYLCYGNGPYFLLSFLFLANFAPAFGVPTPHGPGVFWSLAIEEHFYFVWPLAARYLRNAVLLALAIAIIVVSPALRYWAMSSGFSFEGVYQFSFYRFDGLALGAVLAIWKRSPYFTKRGAVMLSAILLGAMGTATVLTIPYGVFGTGSPMGVALRSTQAQALFATTVVIALAWRGTLLTAPLRWRFALYSAKLSYCLYLVHLSMG